MHCCIMGFLKQLAVCIIPFPALHKNSVMKTDKDYISTSPGRLVKGGSEKSLTQRQAKPEEQSLKTGNRKLFIKRRIYDG